MAADEYHLAPENDLREHTMDGRPCWCGARADADGLTVHKAADAREIMEALSWRADQIITNHFGERVWLRQSDARSITDCCLVVAPCEYHARLVQPAPAKVQ